MNSKDKPIATLTVNQDISKMTKTEINRLRGWLFTQSHEILCYQESFGKLRARLYSPKKRGKK